MIANVQACLHEFGEGRPHMLLRAVVVTTLGRFSALAALAQRDDVVA